MYFRLYRIRIFAAVILAAALCASCTTTARRGAGENGRRGGVSSRITLVAAGDNLIHIEIINDARNGGGYNFEPVYSEIKPVIAGADIAFVNQETLIAGPAFEFSGYPEFNGPVEIGDALVKTGFNVVNHATNHVLDKGKAAVYAVMDYWEKRPEIALLGIHRSAASRSGKKAVIEKKNIKIGWLSYTYGTNGIPLPQDSPYLVSLIDTKVMAEEINALRPFCDFLIVSMHWGEEYRHTPNRRQEELAEFLAAHNVDLVIGHHPHVIQPVREIKREDGGATLVFFSLGNFLSCQKEKARLLGALARVTITKTVYKTAPPDVTVSSAEIIPIVTHYSKEYKNFKIYQLGKYTEKLMLEHGIQNSETTGTDYFMNLNKTVFGGLNVQ
ncbi:MAG: CapA family protein [Spirochaetaceae bacterium]|jgi:poly-gamma-glutamate synthesis protein (capsule biosynthesis protein)|nr:CapA family protein [Spirochaetaceae bacterium]